MAEHGVCADPSNVTLTGQDTTVVDDALSIVNDFESAAADVVGITGKAALAVTVPALVFAEELTDTVWFKPAGPGHIGRARGLRRPVERDADRA